MEMENKVKEYPVFIVVANDEIVGVMTMKDALMWSWKMGHVTLEFIQEDKKMDEEKKENVEYRSLKSRTIYIVNGTKTRAYLQVTGEASTNPKVIKEIDRIRRQGGSWYEVEMTAKQFSHTY